ncbi:hypothetical protein [Paenibacillus sp. F411]|uniref:hypothetical protein n=1 Tax=Paenibacillus sp. F411 TaxID=2820239 RepID=UPI003266EBAB
MCSGAGCRGWQRMDHPAVPSSAAGPAGSKACPLCGAPMQAGMKQAPAAGRRPPG